MELEVAGVVIHLHSDRIELSRRGRPELPGAVLRFGAGDAAAEVDLFLRLSAGHGPAIERRVVSIPTERMVRWYTEFQEELGRRFMGQLEWTTPEELGERGYVVLVPGPDHNARWLEHMAPSHGQGRRVFNPEGLESEEAAAIMLDSAIEAVALREICVPGEKRDMMWAVHCELTSPNLIVLWLETPEGWRWGTVSLDSWGEQLQEAMRSRMPATVLPLMDSLIRHLCLEELGFDHKRLVERDLGGPAASPSLRSRPSRLDTRRVPTTSSTSRVRVRLPRRRQRARFPMEPQASRSWKGSGERSPATRSVACWKAPRSRSVRSGPS